MNVFRMIAVAPMLLAYACVPSSAQDAQPAPPVINPKKNIPEVMPDSGADPDEVRPGERTSPLRNDTPRSLTEQLGRTGGVIEPPTTGAPSMNIEPPVPHPNTTPVIPPPGTPGNPSPIVPK